MHIIKTIVAALAVNMAVTSAQATLIKAPDNLSFVSSNAVPATTNPNFVSSTIVDGILNANESNGAVFNLTNTIPTEFIIDFVNVGSVEDFLLYQLVGGAPDNGIQDFSLEFFTGSAGGGSQIGTAQSFSAALDSTNGAQTFTLVKVLNPGSMALKVTSAYAAITHAEFSEIAFNGSIRSVPEPNLFGMMVFAVAGLTYTRRRIRK